MCGKVWETLLWWIFKKWKKHRQREWGVLIQYFTCPCLLLLRLLGWHTFPLQRCCNRTTLRLPPTCTKVWIHLLQSEGIRNALLFWNRVYGKCTVNAAYVKIHQGPHVESNNHLDSQSTFGQSSVSSFISTYVALPVPVSGFKFDWSWTLHWPKWCSCWKLKTWFQEGCLILQQTVGAGAGFRGSDLPNCYQISSLSLISLSSLLTNIHFQLSVAHIFPRFLPRFFHVVVVYTGGFTHVDQPDGGALLYVQYPDVPAALCESHCRLARSNVWEGERRRLCHRGACNLGRADLSLLRRLHHTWTKNAATKELGFWRI